MQVDKGDGGKASSRNADPTRDEAPAPGESEVLSWLAARAESIQREKDYRKQAGDVTRIYEAGKKEENSYNILYANTDTLSPALYSQPPRPVCERRYKDADPIGKAVAQVCQRTLEFLSDTNDEDYESFDELMKAAVTSALVPGRGLFRWKYDDKTVGGKLYRKVCGEAVPWDRFTYGYARFWKDVPWVGFDHYMTRDEVEENFTKAVAAKLDFTAEQADQETDSERTKRRNTFSDEGVGKAKLCLVFEVWDKAKMEVRFYSPGYKEGALKKVSDPLGLTGFFPMVKPLQLVRKISTLTPTPLYIFYEEQAKELNRVTQRINKLVAHLKVRGVYDGRIGELEKVFSLNDGEMTPAESMDSLDQATRLEQSLWFMPIDKLVAALQQLYLQRAQVKQVIYELTGIADIMRGSSAASETLGAQEIKERWGGVRLKRMQKEVARFACDNLRMVAELAFGHFDEQTFKDITGLPYPTSQEKQNAQQLLQAAQTAMALQQQGPMAPGAQPPPPDPRVVKLQAVVQLPSYGEILSVGKVDQLRNYKIDIETNSTVDLEVTEDKRDIQEMMVAFTQAIQGLAPLVKEGAMPWEAAKATILAMARRFRFGREIEDLLAQMGAPKGDGEDAKAKADLMKAQAEHQLEVKRFQDEMALERQRFQMEQQQAAVELQQARQKFEAELQMMREKHAHELKLAQEKQDADTALREREALAKAQLDRDNAIREDQRAERDGQRDRAIQRKKDDEANNQHKAMETMMQQLIKVVESLADKQGNNKPAGAKA